MTFDHAGFEEMLAARPGLPVVLPHIGYPDFEWAFRLAADHNNVWLDVTNVAGSIVLIEPDDPEHRRQADEFREGVSRFRGRIMFGTDHPAGMGPIERIFTAGMTEWRRSLRQEGGLIPGTQSRVDRAMNVAIARESEAANKRLSYLATVGSVSPFVGLFGTVWGIKHAFESIAVQQNTNLAVVAPGIAEALLATALGLLAAIPAVVAYNRLSADAERLTGGLENFADEFSTILGRQIDRQSAGQSQSPIQSGGE